MIEAVSKTPGLDDGDDLFDLPVEALNLPGMDALDPAAALAAFKLAEPEIAALAEEPEPQEDLPEESPSDIVPDPETAPRSRTKWIVAAAVTLGTLIPMLPRLFQSSPSTTPIAELPSTAPTKIEPDAVPTPIVAKETPPAHPPEVARTASEVAPPHPSASSNAAHEVTAPPITAHETSAPPVAAHETTAPVHETVAPAHQAAALAHEAAAPPREAELAAREATVPPVSRSGRARLKAAETTLEAGHPALARAELGRLLLDLDALPPNERDDTRAEAELLAARILQDTVDETRKSPR